MPARNRGIEHLWTSAVSVLCRRQDVHVAVDLATFRALPVAYQCKRCAAKLARMDLVTERRSLKEFK